MIANDKVGQPFQAGDFIAYGHALGRCAGLRIGKVLAIKQVDGFDWMGPRNQTPKKEWRITVVGVADDWAGRPLELCKKGTLQFPERCLKLDPAAVPTAYLELYEKAGLFATGLKIDLAPACPECETALNEPTACPFCGWAKLSR